MTYDCLSLLEMSGPKEGSSRGQGGASPEGFPGRWGSFFSGMELGHTGEQEVWLPGSWGEGLELDRVRAGSQLWNCGVTGAVGPGLWRGRSARLSQRPGARGASTKLCGPSEPRSPRTPAWLVSVPRPPRG